MLVVLTDDVTLGVGKVPSCVEGKG
jgi:hypothetical protein